MNRFLTACIFAASVATPAMADLYYEAEIVDGVRVLEPTDPSKLNARGQLVQERIVELGFFSWPVPTEKAAIEDGSGPAVVFDCPGHHPDYLPANKMPRGLEKEDRHARQAKGHIYDWFAYRNAIVAGDCSCGSLSADWEQAQSIYATLDDGINEPTMQRHILSNLRVLIHNDYDRMCDVRTLLDLE